MAANRNKRHGLASASVMQALEPYLEKRDYAALHLTAKNVSNQAEPLTAKLWFVELPFMGGGTMPIVVNARTARAALRQAVVHDDKYAVVYKYLKYIADVRRSWRSQVDDDLATVVDSLEPAGERLLGGNRKAANQYRAVLQQNLPAVIRLLEGSAIVIPVQINEWITGEER